jgi:2-iminobutanoate/2-iminopropanoate deaminase
VKVGNRVFVSGQASVDPTGKIVADPVEGEVRRSIGNLAEVLRTAGRTLADGVRTRTCVRDIDRPGECAALDQPICKAAVPARTTIASGLPPALHSAIEAIAVVPGGLRRPSYSAASACASAAAISAARFSTSSTMWSIIRSLLIVWLCLPAT